MIIRVILEWDEDTKSYPVSCAELNCIYSCGDPKKEATNNLKEAIQLLLKPFPHLS